jgi:hemerythrin
LEAAVTLLTWNHACSIGVKAMDDQHGVLMDTLNDLRLTLVQGRGRDQVSEGLNRLIEFTRMHFTSEEHLLEQHGFPGLAEHRKAHQRLLAEIEEAAVHAQHNDDLHTGSMLIFLRDWHMKHVDDLDQKYGAWLNARGIA